MAARDQKKESRSSPLFLRDSINAYWRLAVELPDATCAVSDEAAAIAALLQQQPVIGRSCQQSSLEIQSGADGDSRIGRALPGLAAVLAFEHAMGIERRCQQPLRSRVIAHGEHVARGQSTQNVLPGLASIGGTKRAFAGCQPQRTIRHRRQVVNSGDILRVSDLGPGLARRRARETRAWG